MGRDELIAMVRRAAAVDTDAGCEVRDVPGGWTSGWIKRLCCGGQDLFCKQIKANEARTLRRIAPLGLRHMVPVPYPELLDQGLLVTPFVEATPIREKVVLPELLRDLAAVQNHLNQPDQVALQPPGGATHDAYMIACLEIARERLPQLQRPWAPALSHWAEWLEERKADERRVAALVNAMPRAWLHHDFREANILDSEPQLLVDWGSSYGYGPFLFDVAPFIYGLPAQAAAFCEQSDIARACLAADVARWLVAALVARGAGYIRWALIRFIERGTPMDAIERELAYEWRTYGLSTAALREALGQAS